jgi:hypothetical protein
MKINKSIFNKRFFEIVFPLCTWALITMPVWLSPFHPAVVAYFIIIFDVYFFYKTFKTVILATISYINIKKSKEVDWLEKARKEPNFTNIKHFIIIPNYQETFEKVSKSIDTIVNQNYVMKNVYVVLALEKSEGKVAVLRAEKLKAKYGSRLGGFYASVHQLMPGEQKGKASNQTFAAKLISEKVGQLGFSAKDVIITSCDADTLVDEQYLAYLTTTYLLDKQNRYHFYTAPVLLYNNYWKLNFFIRIQTTLSSIMRLAFLSEKHNLIQISVYSCSLWLLESVNYWDVDIVSEDWHVFLQAFFEHGVKVRTVPIYLINTRDGVRGKNLIESLKNRYVQEKRWAWGVSDIPYALEKAIYSKKLTFFDKFFRILSVSESHLLWPSSFFLLTLGANIPALINPYFKRTVMGYLLPQIAGGILTLTASFVLVIAYLDYQTKSTLLKKTETNKFPILIIQWILFPVLSPIISAFLSSIPALESHTRLLLGKKLDYKVTKKF